MSWSDSPWVRGELRIRRDALSIVERDAIAGYEAEQEACGYLAGPLADPLLCDRAEPIENLAKILHERDPATFFHPARKFFAFHERTLEAAIRDGEERASPVKVLYHSHLDVGAYMSGTDEAVLSRGAPPSFLGGAATLGPGPAWPLAFLVSSVRRTDGAPFVDDHRLFVWEKRRFVASTFEIV